MPSLCAAGTACAGKTLELNSNANSTRFIANLYKK